MGFTPHTVTWANARRKINDSLVPIGGEGKVKIGGPEKDGVSACLEFHGRAKVRLVDFTGICISGQRHAHTD
jgi:hypothetical protein